MRYILDQLEGEDKVIKFDEKQDRYIVRTDDVCMGFGGVELLIYSFLFEYAFEYWDEDIDPSGPAGQIYIEMNLHDFVKVTGCSVQDVRNALETLNQDRWVRVIEIKKEWGITYAYHATI